ncbi:hypothetical protein [Nonomuraea endophytica]|uniref:hypothetical protein n=1 Tax=Nonomuraea endophytica TaxID=714136 RepID=UPI0037C894B9
MTIMQAAARLTAIGLLGTAIAVMPTLSAHAHANKPAPGSTADAPASNALLGLLGGLLGGAAGGGLPL